MAPRRRRVAPIVAISGPSGVGKTRLIARLLPHLAGLGLRVGVIKHSSHRHGFDVPGKDTDLVRRAGAVAAAITGPGETAWFGPPVAGARALARLLPPVDLVIAEGFKQERLRRVEVYRRSVARRFLCASDRGVIALVTDTAPPRPLPAFGDADEAELAAFLVDRLGLRPRRRRR
jgi:molybdopterin-guanine dinucleotide biosynthesis protein B